MKRDDLVKWLDEYLKINEVEDGSWNGLQAEGSIEVKKIALGVDAGLDLFKKAAEDKTDLIIVHHGMFWKNWNPSIVSANKQSFSPNKDRVEFLLKSGLSLYAAHLPLDRHKEVGNNAMLLKIIGARITDEFDIAEGKNTSWLGEFKKEKSLKEIVENLKKSLQTECKIIPFGKKEIKKVAVCTGGGGYSTHQLAFESGVDLYITGDPIEVYQWDKDAKFNVIFAGHYATETLGVKALGEVIKNKFDVNIEFIDIPTGF
ncbi:Nif3-like dinuclear metal center hexameric protein [Candidatus Daviesbacteria bacterium]|nr:Nif3-like dinuclear metal center hexameric protein [Candidatus Daviesbacteria bacterium]